MTEIDPKFLEWIKNLYGAECELVEATEWSYSYKHGPKSYGMTSKFMLDKDLTVSADLIRRQWPQWSQRQRLDFSFNWMCKQNWTDEDTQILEIIMADGDDQIWENCAQVFLKHPDRERIVHFLIDRVMHYPMQGEPLNYFQVLGMSRDLRAVPAMHPFYEKYKKAVDAEAIIGVPTDVFFGPIPYHAFLSTAGSLFEITGSSEYEQAIRKFFEHEHKQVRYWAQHALSVEGLTAPDLSAENDNNPS